MAVALVERRATDGGQCLSATKEYDMSSHTYKITEIVGSSPDGVDAAIRSGIARADDSLRNLDWFEVTEIRGHLEEGAVAHFQVTMKVGFRLEDD